MNRIPLRNKKGSESLPINKLIYIILAVLVIVLVIFLIFRVDILEWLRNQPEWHTSVSDEEVDMSQMGDEEAQRMQCPVRIAKLVENKIKFCGDEMCSDEKLIGSELYLSQVNIENSEIYTDQPYGIDDKIGDVENKIIIIFQEILEKKGKIYEEVKNELPYFKDLLNLNNSYFWYSNLICRKEKIEVKETEEVKLDTESSLKKLNELILNYGENMKYSSNKEIKDFIDKLFADGIITKEEYIEINGGGYLDLNTEENLVTIKEILEKKKQEEISKLNIPNIKKFTYSNKNYYLNIDEFIKQKNSFHPPEKFSLYTDIHHENGELALESEDYLFRDNSGFYHLIVKSDELETAYPIEIINNQGNDYIDLESYLEKEFKGNIENLKVLAGKEERKLLTDSKGIPIRINNYNNYLGVDTGGDSFIWIYFRWDLGRIYIMFSDDDFVEKDISPWILLDYWNEYRTFKNAPGWAIILPPEYSGFPE